MMDHLDNVDLLEQAAKAAEDQMAEYRARIAELEAEIEAVGAGGVQRLAATDDFPLGKACDLSGEGECEACQ